MIDETTQAAIEEFKAIFDKLFEQKSRRDEQLMVLDKLEQKRIELCIEKLQLEIKHLREK